MSRATPATYDGMDMQSMAQSGKLPSFHDLNPFAHYGHNKNGGAQPQEGGPSGRWQPVPGLVHSKESLALRQSIGSILKQVHEEVSTEKLEIRANTPEYRLETDDWIAHQNSKNVLPPTLKSVARLPMSLLTVNPRAKAGRDPSKMTMGMLKKRGETNKAFKKRFFDLEGKQLSYYRKEPYKNGVMLGNNEKASLVTGVINLHDVSAVQPHGDQSVAWGFELVTTARTWILAAESEQEYHMWVEAICHSVPFHSVNIIYRRMLQLAEVSANAANEVRLVLLPSYTVEETVEHIFECYQNMLDAVPLHPYNPKDYVLKLTGFRDYMIDPKREVSNYQHVRECLLTKKTLCLTLVHRSKIDGPELLKGLSQSQDLLYNEKVCLLTSKGSRSNLNFTTLGGEWKEGQVDNQDSTQAVGKSCHYHEPLRFCINRVLNIPRYTTHLKRDAHEVGVEGRPLLFTNGIVVVELYNGGKLLEPPIETTDVRMKAQMDDGLIALWTEPRWYRTKTRLNEIPRSARLVFTLYGVRKNQGGSVSNNSDGSDRERIHTTGINVFDVEGLIAQGEQYVQMIDNLHHCHYGSVPHIVDTHKPLIHVSLSSYHTDIAFDWSTGNGWVEKENTHRSVTLEKSGWLKKTGKSFTLSQWQKRWFHLIQKTNSLSYAEDINLPVKHTINIAGATVRATDELNSKFTTFVTSKSTKKEQQTWVFKLKPADTNREFVFSANSKQEREEWMTAINMVARGETFSDDEDNQLEGDTSNLSIASNYSEPRPSVLRSVMMPQSSVFLTQRASSVSSNSTDSNMRALDDLRSIIASDPLYRLSSYEKAIMWKNRHQFKNDFDALPRILTCVNWSDSREVEEVVSMLPQWNQASHPAGYIRLLDMEFANESVREFAVQKLSEMADTTFSYFLPQLVQALKYENHHVSPLAKHLIKRAIENPNQIGFDLFWAMKVESYNEQYKERYGLLLNTYVDVCSRKMRSILELQDKLFSEKGEFEDICQMVKQLHHQGKTKEDIKTAMRERLTKLNETLPSSYQLPIDPRVEVGKILVHKCKIMSSAKLPLWLEFENAEEGGDPVAIMFKAGDDVRQDCLTLQLIRLMDEMWREDGKDLAMEPYKCVSTGPMTGLVQIVLHSVTTAAIHKRGGGVIGAFDDTSFASWIFANNGDPRSYKTAVDLFLRSCAGYCVATYVLGIGDRHNDNIMMTKQGRYFHIDFGHFLGFMKYQYGIKREQTPFVFTPEMRYVFKPQTQDGRDEYPRFQKLCGEAFNVVRRHMHLLVSLLLLMIPADMPELRHRDDISHIVEVTAQKLTDEEAAAFFADLTNQCMSNTMKRIDNTLHIIKHR
ncbi:hypothetical protein LEN26_006542 [Aphanomyces euteiches]|nr:hypothetical protein AeMF1_007108 [Aphanomyces euteiches]KAH9120979.1 hypothetical protein AeMF1_007081 [Aphanomyces euteiches]KAH9135175.1 hypothetical protein LEN26_006542 [Aphanomyces euteiches]KAH9192880.1 hypothetical protein AeNC1_005140 [Aphanomyces euteiches]